MTKLLYQLLTCTHNRLKVVRGENLPFGSTGELLIEVSLHLGAKTLHGAKRTSWKVQDSYNLTWNEELEFLTELKDIPKAAKILVIVRQRRGRDTAEKNRVFYWGLLTVFDHRFGNSSIHMQIVNRSRRYTSI